jgi:hypothetical protein
MEIKHKQFCDFVFIAVPLEVPYISITAISNSKADQPHRDEKQCCSGRDAF